MKLIILLMTMLIAANPKMDLKPVDSESKVSFVIKNFGINTGGEIKGLTGSIRWDETNPVNSVFNVNADVNTINTGIEMRDNHLKDEAYFFVEKHPQINFTSTSVSSGDVTGNLTIKGITKQISFPFTVSKSVQGYVFEGGFTINRRDFDIGSSSFSLGNSVNVSIKVKAVP